MITLSKENRMEEERMRWEGIGKDWIQVFGHIRRDSGYWVKGLEKKDITEIYKLCSKNTIFYQYHPPFVTEKSILQDMAALPPGKEPWEKAFLGFYEEERLIAILDLILNYPKEGTAYIGLFMTEQEVQGRGIGSELIGRCIDCLAELNVKKIRLAVDKGNPQSEAFWVKNHFVKTGEEVPNDFSAYLPMERILSE